MSTLQSSITLLYKGNKRFWTLVGSKNIKQSIYFYSKVDELTHFFITKFLRGLVLKGVPYINEQ